LNNLPYTSYKLLLNIILSITGNTVKVKNNMNQTIHKVDFINTQSFLNIITELSIIVKKKGMENIFYDVLLSRMILVRK
jgi:hypothetical protein